jgi:hypothetical protein
MALWRKTSRPVDRVVGDLDRQIAALQKQMRQLTHEPAQRPATGESSVVDSVGGFFKRIATPEKKPLAPSYRSIPDLFDGGNGPLKGLEADTVAFARKTDPDLIPHVTNPGGGTASGTTVTSAQTQEKLVHYLSAGSIKTYKPLKRAQRQTRNRFLMWLGLSFVTFWIIYVVVR